MKIIIFFTILFLIFSSIHVKIGNISIVEMTGVMNNTKNTVCIYGYKYKLDSNRDYVVTSKFILCPTYWNDNYLYEKNY